MTLSNFDKSKLTMIGSMLFTRSCSGARIITTTDLKTIEEYKFKGFGCHTSNSNMVPYITCAAGIGMRKEEVDNFVEKLDKILLKVRSNKS